MSATKSLLALVLIVSAVTPIFAQQPTERYNGRDVASNEIILRARTNGAANLLTLVADLLPNESIRVLNQQLGLYLLHSPNRRVATLVSAFAARADLLYAEPNFKVQSTAVPNDPSFSQLWGLQKVSAPQAWDVSSGTRTAIAAVVDTGISYTHPDLVQNIWSAPTAFTVTVNGRQISCPAGSHGFNAITMGCDPADDAGHGTHVAGTIGAAGNNDVGVTGLNWAGSVMALKFLDSSGSGTLSNAINAIEFAIQVKRYYASTSTPANIRVLSNSWGGSGYSQALLDEINSAGANEMLFVVAAGNASANTDIAPTYPASYRSAAQITVAATDANDALASFSNFGSATVHLGAPGVNILSTYPGNSYAYASGTSMATPHVSGAALLVLSACPSLSTAALKNTLLANTDPLSSLSGITVSGGRLNVNRAITSCATSFQPALSGVTVSPSTIQSGEQGVITINLTSPARSGGAVVSLASSNPGVSVPSVVIIPQGSSVASTTFTAGFVSVSLPFTLTASYLGVNQTATGTLNPAAAAASVTFLTVDTTTQGTWKGKYGSEGLSLVGDVTQNPSYVVPSSNGAQYTWASSTSDVRALQRVSGSDRIAATWYGNTFTIDLNFADQNAHQVAIYCVDWDSYGPRNQTIDILDGNDNVIDTRSVTNFQQGRYLVWSMVGHVKIRATALVGNAVIDGIFFGSHALSPPAAATFLTTDTTTQGTWKGKYGSEGFSVVGDVTQNPSYVVPSSNGAQYTWASSTSDVRALQRVSGSDRIAATWYGNTFTVDLNFADQNAHQVAIYCVDWDNYGPRNQIIDILDANDNVIDTRSVTTFQQGRYLVWSMVGHVKIRATALVGNAVIDGIFFGSPALSPPAATFLTTDTTTQGNWKGKYGSEGLSLVGDVTQNPSYVVPASNGAQWTWASSTSDVRALQRLSGSDRIAATWFGSTFTIDLNFADQNAHQVAIYCVDWDNYGPRNQTIDILDANDNVVDTRSVTNFEQGRYLVWSMVGHVKIRATALVGNAVIDGIFFQ